MATSIEEYRRQQLALGAPSSIEEYRRRLEGQADQSFASQMNAQRQPSATANAGAVSPEDAKRAADLAEQEGLSKAGIDRLKNDDTDKLLRDYLQKQMGAQVLDPAGKPFANGAPQHTAANATAAQMRAEQAGNVQMIGGGGPWDATSKSAFITDAANTATAAESARNQMLRDALLSNGGNAFDPSLRAAEAESFKGRQDAVAGAQNQVNMVANRENFAAQRQADLANQSQLANREQFNAGSRQQANSANAQFGQQAALANQGAQNQAGMFNTNNQMTAQNANFNAGNQALMYNNQNQNQANAQLAGYNNQRENMLQNAEGNRINLIGQNRYSTGQPNTGGGGGMPSFQQYQQQATPRPVQQNAGFQNPSIAGGLTGSVWAGSGKPSVGSGATTNQFGPTQVGNPYGAGASVGTTRPAVTRPTQQLPPVQGVPPMLARPQELAPQIKKPLPNNYNSPW